MASPPRILIVTAAFGEGHNSAARNLALALDAAGALTQVSDPCVLGIPRLTAVVNHGYRYVTTHFPQLWARIYRSTDNCDFSRQRSLVMRRIETALADLVRGFKPDAVVSTYPLYPYFMTRILADSGQKTPVFVVVTDSIEINAAWLRAKCDRWLVTDPATRDAMIRAGLDGGKIVDTGFPVHPDFSKLTPLATSDGCDPFRILYFPTAKLPFVRRHARALLDASPAVRLTIILGRNVRALYSRAREIQQAYPGRVRLIGWTRRVPQFLNNHHLVVGKAGGATVHEAIAARCPMLIHHLVPGQEEGNLRLLEIIGGGYLAATPAALTRSVTALLADHAAGWHTMKNALADHGRNAGALAAARYILAEIGATRRIEMETARATGWLSANRPKGVDHSHKHTQRSTIEEVIDAAFEDTASRDFVDYSVISAVEAAALQADAPFDVSGWKRRVEADSINKILSKHASDPFPLTEEDIRKLPDLHRLSNTHAWELRKNEWLLKTIVRNDRSLWIIEEARTGQKTLNLVSMYRP